MSEIFSLPHNRSEFFGTEKYWNAVEKFFAYELENDGEDLSAEFFLEKGKTAQVYVIAKEEGIIAGKEELTFFLQKFFSENSRRIKGNWLVNDQEKVQKNQRIFEAEGDSKALMKFERVFLNVLSRMSGIATQTQKLVGITENSPIQIAATRKTQWSYLDKKAVHIGGGLTHRMGLFDAIMIKENHQIVGDYNLPISGYLDSLKNKKISHFLEIEVETPEEFSEIFDIFWNVTSEAGKKMPKVIMLDNFSPEKIRETLEKFPEKTDRKYRYEKNIFLEASGGISAETIEEYKNSGVDVVSMGSLTNFVKPIDFSMRVEKK